MEHGWIKLHRSIQKNWIWQDAIKLKWWLDLLLMANHSSKKILLGNNLMEIPRGSLHTSMVHLAERWNADKKTVKKFLDLLQKDSMISFTTSIKGTTISISNYNCLQGPRESEDLKSSTSPTPSKFEAVDTNMDNPMDNTMDNSMDNILDNSMDKSMDSKVDNRKDSFITNDVEQAMDTPVVSTLDTNNNYNNINNSKNAKEREDWKEGAKPLTSNSTSTLCFSSPTHEKIYNTLGEIAYRTWFMDCAIQSSPNSTVVTVDSDFKKSVIDSKFKVKLNTSLGKMVEVKVA